jgi:3-oxoacyl-[acyl-carrier protein] reductase
VARLRAEVEDRLGPTEVLFAFAGGFGARTPLLETELDEWNGIVESNLTSTFLTLKEFAPGMVERGAGSIVTMASNAARFLDIQLTASYAAAKAGIMVLSRHAALELGPMGVRVNCLAPATILSERVKRNMDEERLAGIAEMSPLGTIGHPDDPALAALFLASDSARWMTGVTLDVAGGRIMM